MLNASSNRMSLKRRVFDAGAWSLAGVAVSYAIRLGSSLVMTRLLVPQMFGVMAIAMLVMAALAMLSDVGLSQNIVQSKRGDDPAFLNTAWTIQILRGLLLWLLALCIALFVVAANHIGLVPKASVYADFGLPHVIAAVSISAAIGGFESTKLSEAARHLALGRVTRIRIAAQIVGLICMISWALIDRSIWALVAGSISATAATTLLSHLSLPGISNRWHWDRSAAHEIVHFGKWMFLSSILGFFANNADRILLGGLVDAPTLGIYSIAFTIVNSVVQILNTLFSLVSFPAFSEIARERSVELRRGLYRFHTVTASFAYFCSGLLIVSGNSLVTLLYDRRYAQAGWMLEILAVGLLTVPFYLGQFSLLARGLPRLFASVIGIRVGVAIVLIPLGFHLYGMPGALWGIVLGHLSSAPVTIYFQIKYHLFDLPKELLLLPMLLVGMILGSGLNLAIGHGL